MLKIRNSSIVAFVGVIITFILFTSCSLKQADMSAPKKAIESKPSIVTQEDEKTLLTQAIVNFYGDKNEPIVVYQQIPFEDGTLVLAERVTDGEHYPDLHFIDRKGNITYHTRGSYCWTLNYTQFKGYYIFFGLAGVETRQYNQNQITVKKVEALFLDKTESAIVGENILAHINSKKKDSRIFKKPQGYIMPVKGEKMPLDFVAILGSGEEISLFQKTIDYHSEYLPDYLKVNKKDIYNSFEFTFSPMLTPIEWIQGFIEGEILLEGKTDVNGNRNALFLRPAGNITYTGSFILPQDMKPFYLSNNSTRTTSFSVGETIKVVYPKSRKLIDCHILRLATQMVDKEINQNNFALIVTNEKREIVLPKGRGYYLFVLRIEKVTEIQTYTGLLKIN